MIKVRTTTHSGFVVTTAETLDLTENNEYRYRCVRIVGDFGAVEQHRVVSPKMARQLWDRMHTEA